MAQRPFLLRPSDPSASRRPRPVVTIEDQVRYAAYTPTLAYDPYDPRIPSLGSPRPLGKISNAKVPSPLDGIAKSKAFVPGPGKYQGAGEFSLPEGGRLWGPQQPPPPEKLFKAFCPEGGRTLSASKPPSYFDQAPKLFDGQPGPDKYDLPGSLQTKNVGRCVYRYESATIAESKALVKKATGVGVAAPGPGTYDLPEPPLLSQAPSVKGRATPSSFVLPHPWARHCMPVWSRNLNSLAPVRQHNSAEQIFGTGLQRTAAGVLKPVQPRSASADPGDQVDSRELPSNVGPPVDEDEEAAVRWRSGGFSSLRKVRSAGALAPPPPPEHPSVELAQKSYPKLSRKHGRASDTFLPMSSRRTESIPTNDGSDEYQRICRGKWQLKTMMECIQAATEAALEPLNEAKLRDAAMQGLKDKASERMRLEGVSNAQQRGLWHEMVDVLQERTEAVSPGSTTAA